MGYSMLSADLAPPAPRRLHSTVSDFTSPSVTESGEAALRGVHASRAFGGYPLTSDDLTPGSLTVFPSPRVARPQDAAKALHFGSLVSSSVRIQLDASQQRMLRPVCDTETQLGPAGRSVSQSWYP